MDHPQKKKVRGVWGKFWGKSKKAWGGAGHEETGVITGTGESSHVGVDYRKPKKRQLKGRRKRKGL